MNKDDIEIYGYAYFCKFLDYFKSRGILHKKFKMKYFNPVDSYNCSGGLRPYSDIGLSMGQVRYAFAFGHRHGFIVDVSNSKRCFDLVHLRSEGFL